MSEDNSAMPEPNDDEVLHITNTEVNRVPVLVAQGDVDLSTTGVLRHALEAACEAKPESKKVAVDMRKVPFIDSAGLALLVEIRKRYYDRCQLALVIEKSSQPERVLRLGRFDTFLQVTYSPEELQAA